MPREIGGSSFSTAAALCTIGGHWTDICPSDWATYKIRPLHKFEIVCQHFFPLFNSGIRHSVDRIIDTLIEQLLLRGRRDVNEAWISMPEWKSVSELGRVYHSRVYHGRVYHGRVPTTGTWCIWVFLTDDPWREPEEERYIFSTLSERGQRTIFGIWALTVCGGEERQGNILSWENISYRCFVCLTYMVSPCKVKGEARMARRWCSTVVR